MTAMHVDEQQAGNERVTRNLSLRRRDIQQGAGGSFAADCYAPSPLDAAFPIGFQIWICGERSAEDCVCAGGLLYYRFSVLS
jgi:hypothetical protein